MSDDSQYVLTEADRLEAERLERDLVKKVMQARKEGAPPIWTSDKFTSPIGLREDGTPQAPLTSEERAHNAKVRRQTEDKKTE